MLALLGFILGLIIVAICIPIKIFQLGLSVKNTKAKLDVKKEKAKNSSIKGKLSQLGKRKNSDNADKEKKPLLTGNKDIQKLKASRGNKKEQKKVIKKINLKTKMVDLIIAQLRALLGILLPTGQSLIIAGLFSALIFLVVLVALIAACSFIVMLFEGSGGSGVSVGMSTGSSVEDNADTNVVGTSLESMAKWYIANVKTYQQNSSGKGSGSRQGYSCDLLGGKTVYDDCTGFSAAYASLVSGKNVTAYGSKDLYNGGQSYIDAGWKRYTIAEIGGVSGLKYGDILVCNSEADSKCKGHHAEIFISVNSSFGWGKIQGSIPSSTSTFVDSSTYPGYIDQGTSHRYGVVYRFVGASSSPSSE